MKNSRARAPKIRPKQASQSSRKPKKRHVSALERLRPEESARVLRMLIDRHAELRPELEDLARSIVSEINLDGFVDRVERALLDIDMEELGARGGRTIGGYVEPAEAAWELLDEALQPFLNDLKRSIELGLEPQAVEQSKGIVLGLYQSDQKASNDHVLEWAPDFPLEGAGEVVHLLERESRKHQGKPWRMPNEFLIQVPKWARYFAPNRQKARKAR